MSNLQRLVFSREVVITVSGIWYERDTFMVGKITTLRAMGTNSY